MMATRPSRLDPSGELIGATLHEIRHKWGQKVRRLEPWSESRNPRNRTYVRCEGYARSGVPDVGGRGLTPLDLAREGSTSALASALSITPSAATSAAFLPRPTQPPGGSIEAGAVDRSRTHLEMTRRAHVFPLARFFGSGPALLGSSPHLFVHTGELSTRGLGALPLKTTLSLDLTSLPLLLTLARRDHFSASATPRSRPRYRVWSLGGRVRLCRRDAGPHHKGQTARTQHARNRHTPKITERARSKQCGSR